MKIYSALTAAAAVTVCVSAAMAADADRFVIRGDAAKQLLEQNSINVATAEAIGKSCADEATAAGKRVSIAIFDQFGEPVYYYRMDGQAKIAIDTAIMKARTVLNTRRPSKAVQNAVAQGQSELRQYSFGNFANGGGLPIVINGNQFIGAIGVGGSAPMPGVWSDEICAWRALTKVIGPQPPLLPDIRPAAAAGGGGRAGNGAPNR
ncbi:MAG TPA: heme-binding protein [Micropepsaceae bacterium]|nr:heme-binding protein [Micropepsaceae bacterium]